MVLDSGHNMIPGMDSPAYRSRVNLMTDYNVERQLADEKSSDFIHNARPGDDDIKAAQPKPTVHYPANVPVREAGAHGYHNSPPRLDSRASSVGGGTDDEHDDDEGEDYDWSAEEDLEDQEAQFEKQMGVKPKPQGWGLKRLVYLLKVFVITIINTSLPESRHFFSPPLSVLPYSRASSSHQLL